MAVTRWGFESGLNNDTLTSANAGSDSVVNTGGTSTISTAQAAHGTRSALMVATSTSGGEYFGKTVGATDDLAVDVYLRFAALPASDVGIIWYGDAATQRMHLELLASGALRIRDDAQANQWTSPATLAINTWYRVSFFAHRDPTVGTVRAAYYLLDNTTPVGDSTLLTGKNTGATSYTTVRVGPKVSTGTQVFTAHFDDWGYDDVATGLNPPAGANVDPTANAGTNQNVAASAVVNLSGSGNDSDGSIASQVWSFLFPTSGAPSLTGSTSMTPSFTAGAVGNLYILELEVTDNLGGTGTDTVEVRVPLAGGTETRPLAMDGTTVGSWIIGGGSSTDGGALLDATDATYVESGALTGTEQNIRVRLAPSDPKASASIKNRLWVDAGVGDTVVRLYEGASLRQTWTQAVTSTPTEYTFTLAGGTISAIGDWGNLYVEVGGTT
jgi:hypothetical protein